MAAPWLFIAAPWLFIAATLLLMAAPLLFIAAPLPFMDATPLCSAGRGSADRRGGRGEGEGA
eukprot:3783795-Rhodomonas_salina.1